jgi:ribulose-phosphate 3-epimerase
MPTSDSMHSVEKRARRLQDLRQPGVRIAPSILSADFFRLGEQIRQVESAGTHVLHLDIMDGHFVPNLSIGVPVVASVRKHTDLLLDVHVMISDPLFYAEPFAKAGADLVTFHIEATPEPMKVVQRLRELGVGVGVSLNPGTPAEALTPIFADVDMVLVMTVWPGFGGQKFIEPMLSKIEMIAKHLKPAQRLQVDGGIHSETIGQAAKAGADVFVAGSAVFDAADPAAEVTRLLQLAKAAYEGGPA